MSCIVNPAILEPFIDRRICETLQVALQGLGWIDYVYPIAERGERKKGADSVIYPRVYKQDCNDYIDLFPDDRQESFSFFERRGEIEIDREEDTLTYTLSIVVWANLTLVSPSKTHDYTDQMIVDVCNALDATTLPNALLGSPITVVTDPTLVWDRYTYSYEDYKYHQYPFTTFRVDFTVQDMRGIQCYDSNISINSGSGSSS